MVSMAQSAANWRNMHTHLDRTHSLAHLHQHSYNHVVWNAISAITEFGINFFFKVPGGGTANRSTQRKPQTAFPLISITY